MAANSSSSNFPPGYLEANTAYQVAVPVVVFIVLLFLFSGLRFWSRRIQKSGFLWADILMPLSLLFNLATCAVILVIVRSGTGKHVEAVSPALLRRFSIVSYYVLPGAYLGAVTFPKLAILDLYLNIFVDKITRFTSIGVGIVMILSAIVNFVTIMTQCAPFSQAYDPKPGGHCEEIAQHYTWASLPNIVTDVIMLALPIPVLIRLQATWKMKLGLVVTFLFGSLGLVTSIVRFVEFMKFSWFGKTLDPTWDTRQTLIWTAAEATVYHLAACLLTFRPLIKYIFVESAFAPLLSGSRSVPSLWKDSKHSSTEDSEQTQQTFAPAEAGTSTSYVTTTLQAKSSEAGDDTRDGRWIRIERDIEMASTLS